jgi:hypothetical protein|tara:strand:+ start:197 stop:349 length:153 start_codon:yes stop_codon:yes gene_type:complete
MAGKKSKISKQGSVRKSKTTKPPTKEESLSRVVRDMEAITTGKDSRHHLR